MNRTTALLLALATLLAHSLAIHETLDGEFAAPFDHAHVAYRVARNLVHEGVLSWNPGEASFEPYPSPLWLGVCALSEQLYLGPNRVSQVLGLLFALTTVVVLAQFSPKRLSGVIAPVLLVVSGGLASAATSGSEATAFTVLLTTAFLAFERGKTRALAVLLGLLVLTRPEGILFAATLGVLELVHRPRTAEDGPRRERQVLPFVVAALVYGAMVLVRHAIWGHYLSSPIADLFDPRQRRWALGLAFVRDFYLLAGAPVLVVFPVVCLLRGRLPATSLRALVLVAMWSVVTARGGGDPQPLWGVMVPVLPLLFVAVQDGMTVFMDSRRRGLETLTWTCFVLALLLSVLISKHAGNIGPLKTEGFTRWWDRPSQIVMDAYGRQYGRPGLQQEIDTTERLRSIGVFLRDQVEPGATILTPWPGAIGYLSRRRVLDMLGRLTEMPGSGGRVSWSGRPSVDLVQVLNLAPDFIVGTLSTARRPPLVRQLGESWLMEYDSVGGTPERRKELLRALQEYELVSAPVPIRSDRPNVPTGPAVYLLRRKSLQLSPTIELTTDGDTFDVTVHHEGHQQLVDLEVRLTDAEQRVWTLLPTGEFELDVVAHARTELLLYPTGTRPLTLLSAKLPREVDGVELTAVLRNPGSQHELDFSIVSNRETKSLVP